MICSRCGRQLPDTAKFCNGCGSPTAVSSAPEQTAIPAEGMAVPAGKRKGRIIAVSAIAAVLLLGGGAGFLFREQLFGGKDDSMTQAELEKATEDEEEETHAPDEEAEDEVQSDAEDPDADEEEHQPPEVPEDSRPDTPQGGDIFTPDETERPAPEPTTMDVPGLRSEMTFTYGEDTTDPVESGAQDPAAGETDICKVYWFDASQNADFFFNGEFFVIEFRIKENAPDGSYPVSIYETDIGSWTLELRIPELINGEVAVGRTLPAEQPDAGEAFTMTVGSVRGDRGDTVRVPVKIENNTGFVGCVIDVEYDSSVLEIVDAYSGEAFDHEMNAIY